MLDIQKKALHKRNTVGKQRGFTLIEVMIASFVLAVGMLGSTAMMLRGLQQAEQTNSQAIAMELAVNMAERMRGNIKGVEGFAYDNLSANTSASPSATATLCATLCNSAAVAAYHADVWGVELQDLFPNGNASATVISDSPGVVDSVFRITINWQGNTRTGTDTASITTQTYVMIFQP